jgi:hypothetical protein
VRHVYVLQSYALFEGTRNHLGTCAADAVAGQAQKLNDAMHLESDCQVPASNIPDITISKINVGEAFLQA